MPDPRGERIWTSDGTIVFQRDATGSVTGGFSPVAAASSLDVEALCADLIDPDCAHVWYTIPGALIRARTDGTEIDRYPFPGSGYQLDIRP